MGTSGLYPSTMSLTTCASVPKPGNKSQVVFPPAWSPRRHSHRRYNRVCSKATATPSSSITDFDLYDLLGIDSSSDRSQIKTAYRALQKRCHPDIAGAPGHDMAIILNEAYSVLSDPISRSAYDKEQAKMSEFRGYTGKPLYSTWLGHESERRAVFVDEVRCIGCLKCALLASNTFAVESAYGRARVVSQWADPEDKIQDAIHTCPVDCISIVERSDLAALEFLMSKQPRGNVRLTSDNTGGARVSNIFVEIEKFQRKFREMQEKSSARDSNDSDLQKDTRVSAIQGIRAMANWLYWTSPVTSSATPNSKDSRKTLMLTTRKPSRQQRPNTDKLRQAAAKRRAGEMGGTAGKNSQKHEPGDDEYWTPALILPTPSDSSSKGTSPVQQGVNARKQRRDEEPSAAPISEKEEDHPMSMGIPLVVGVVSAMVVGFRGGGQMGIGLNEHIGGMMALEIVNSLGMQVLLAGVTWYICGAAVVGLIKALGGSKGFGRR